MTVTTEDLNSMYGTLMGFLADAGTRHFDATDAEPSLIELLIVGMFNDGLKTTRERRDYILEGFGKSFDYSIAEDTYDADGFPEALEWFRSDAALK